MLGRKSYVFVSYTTKDAEFVKTLVLTCAGQASMFGSTMRDLKLVLSVGNAQYVPPFEARAQ